MDHSGIQFTPEYTEGYVAHFWGYDEEDNPYIKGTPAFDCWQLGWEDANLDT